jgi:hypothetical protein
MGKDVAYNDLRNAANDLNEVLDLDPKIKIVGQKKDDIIKNIITASKLVEADDNLKSETYIVIETLTDIEDAENQKEKGSPKEEKKNSAKKEKKTNAKTKKEKPTSKTKEKKETTPKGEEKKTTASKNKAKSNGSIKTTVRIMELTILNPEITKVEMLKMLNKEGLNSSNTTINTQMGDVRRFMRALANVGKSIS